MINHEHIPASTLMTQGSPQQPYNRNKQHRTNRTSATTNQSAQQTVTRTPQPLVKKTQLKIESSQRPLPRQHLDIFHHIIPSHHRIIENLLIPSSLKTPNCRLPNHSQPLPDFFVHITTTPTFPMDKQIRGHYKI